MNLIKTKKILIFSGAGFSHPLGLPITSQFQSEISSIRSDLKVYIEETLGKSSSDIERVLSCLEDFINEENLLNTIVKNPVNQNLHFTEANKTIKELREEARETIKRIKRSLFVNLEKFKAEDAVSLYSSFFSEIYQYFGDSCISFFTTNYDLTFERFYETSDFLINNLRIKDVEFNFTEVKNKKVFDDTKEYDWQIDKMEYQKLHGSLDWISDHTGKCIKTGATIIPQNPEDYRILFPGFKQIPSTQPFISIHDNFSKKIATADIIIIIGFAFRDSYINRIFESSLNINKSAVIYCFNPSPLDELPIDSRLQYFVKNFDTFKYLQKGINKSEFPLDLNSNLGESDFTIRDRIQNVIKDMNLVFDSTYKPKQYINSIHQNFIKRYPKYDVDDSRRQILSFLSEIDDKWH